MKWSHYHGTCFTLFLEIYRKRVRIAVDLIQNIAANVVETVEDPYKVDDWVAAKFSSDWFPGKIPEVYDIWNFITMPVCGHCIAL